MSIKTKERKIYNQDLKERFMNTGGYAESTKNTIRYVFGKTYRMEKELNKDIYAFNIDEVNNIFIVLETGTDKSIDTQRSSLIKYVDFCIQQGFVPTMINLFRMHGVEGRKKYVNQIAKEKKFISKDEIIKMTDDCVNKQDKLLSLLLFEGVYGIKFDELVNLKEEDVDFDNNILNLIRDDGNERQLKISDKLVSIIKDSLIETEYLPNNGKSTTGKKKTNILLNTGYILRPTKHAENEGKLKPIVINSRVKRVVNWYGNPYLNPRNIWLSGMLNMAKEIKSLNGKELTREDYEKINDQYGRDKKYWSVTKKELIDYI